MSLYERIEFLRKLEGISQGNLEKELEMSNGSISKWKTSMPKPDRLQKIADHFGVTIDFLMGKTDSVICPICGFVDNPLSEQSRKEHETFHAKFLSVKEKYPFFMEYATANSIRTDAINDFRNPQKSLKERVAAFDNYLKADFSLEISKRNHETDNLRYDDYCKSEVSTLQTDWVITDDLINKVAEKYGVDRNYIDKNAFLLEKVSNDSQLLRILSYLDQLSPDALDMIEIQAEALSKQNKKE